MSFPNQQIAGRFFITNNISDEVLTLQTFFDATKATDDELKHIEGFYSYHCPRFAKIVSRDTIELHKSFQPFYMGR